MDKVTEHLIEGCRRGDRSSQLKLYKQYAQRLYIACLRIVGNSSEAEEAMQDSFLKIFTRLDQYHDGQCFEAWMHRIAIHTAIDYVRRQAPDQEELSDNLAEPETDGPDEEEIQYSVAQIKEATKKLPGRPVTEERSPALRSFFSSFRWLSSVSAMPSRFLRTNIIS